MNNNFDIKEPKTPAENSKEIIERDLAVMVTDPGELTEEDRELYLQFKTGPIDVETLIKRRESANQSQRELIDFILQSNRERNLT